MAKLVALGNVIVHERDDEGKVLRTKIVEDGEEFEADDFEADRLIEDGAAAKPGSKDAKDAKKES